MAPQIGVWSVSDGQPVRIERSRIALESELEDWVERRPSLLAEGLTVVGRQVHLESGDIDLLCIDVLGRWIIVELKRSRLRREAVAQALDYASTLKNMTSEDLAAAIEDASKNLFNADGVPDAVSSQLSEETDRVVGIIVAGTGVEPGLERMVDFLGSFDVPLKVVSFDVFETSPGQSLLMREVVEEERTAGSRREATSRSVASIQEVAATAGVERQFKTILESAEANGLYVRPHVRTVVIAPPIQRNRYLVALKPDVKSGLRVSHAPEAFAEFFPGLTAQDVEDALGDGTGRWLKGDELDTFTTVLVDFLGELPELVEDGDGDDDWDGRSWYFRIGADHRLPFWEDFRRLGLVSSGGAARYRTQMAGNFQGQEGYVYAHLTGIGFAGIGRIVGPAVPWHEAVVPGPHGSGLRLIHELEPDWLVKDKGPDFMEYALPVEWVATCSADEALWETGFFFGSQSNVVRKMSGASAEATIQKVMEHFSIDPADLV